ncbi:MAG: threonine--tRNA ligase [Armatimonadetes bacterium]|nr:threonine--tRNA ligase [Armatimonadota bacterium]
MDAEGKQNDPLYKRRHSLAHILAQAVQKLYPGTRLGFGPPVEHGFYYDFILPVAISDEDFPAIEGEMRQIIKGRQTFDYRELPAEKAIAHLEETGEKLKAEYARELVGKGETLSFYQNGPFEDMCAGPHVEHTSQIPPDSFQLDSVAGAYWRGDARREMMTRIYGLAFGDKKELKAFLKEREEARRFDHRKLGKELEIFMISDQVGPGLPLWLPNGTVLRDELEKLAREWEFQRGYVRVATPHLTDGKLFETSGHLAHYKEGMFPAMTVDEDRDYYLKPMNCPFHHLIFGSRPRSYRELPLRLAEYGTVYRYEPSGTLAGLLRVRGMCMNDAHIYCREDQLEEEFRNVLEMHRDYYEMFRLTRYWMRLSVHDPENREKYVDNPQAWESSERTIQAILENLGIEYEVGFGEAAFYGPKVDFQIRNVVGREETASTNQLDFAIPERFGLTYTGSDGQPHTPYCIHRAPLGTHERFIAFLMEHFKGAFPTWLAPVQVRLIPVHMENFGPYAQELADQLHRAGFRTDIDRGSDTFNKKIRTAATSKIPNVIIVGEKEQQARAVTWRRYCVQQQSTLAFSRFWAILEQLRSGRVMDNFPDIPLPEG